MKVVKRIAIVLVSLVVIVLLATVVMYYLTRQRMEAAFDVQPATLDIPSDSASLALGKHWVDIYCTNCHGVTLEGKRMFEDPSIGFIEAPNLTSGKGGIALSYKDADWVRSIRHGVRPSGAPLFIMPAQDFNYLSDRDLGSIIAYVRSLPAVDNTTKGYELSYFSYVLAALGAFGRILPAEDIDHRSRPSAPPVGVTAAYGEYLVNTGGCRTCHGVELAGGKDPNPNAPPGPNLTRGGTLNTWSEADFIKTIRTGFTPDGRPLQAAFMPWPSFARFSDEELQAVFSYLHGLAPLATKE